MGVQEGKSEYSSNVDGNAWQSGVSGSGQDWGSGVSESGGEWADNADSDSYASGIEDDPATSGTVPEDVKTDYESGINESQDEFESAGQDSENQSEYESAATDDNAREYEQNADADSWESGYTDLSNWGS